MDPKAGKELASHVGVLRSGDGFGAIETFSLAQASQRNCKREVDRFVVQQV
jgi:hypothetical protein